MLQLGRSVRFLRCRVVGELDAALRLARVNHHHLSRRLALRFERINPIGLRAGAKQTGND